MNRILLVLLFVVIGSPANAQAGAWSGSSLLDDPEWQNRFLGSYGFLSGAEPKPSDLELELLREVLELLKTNPTAAESMLNQQRSGTSSASLDYILANLEFQNGKLDAAEKSYAAAIRKFPDFRRAHKNLGLLHVQQGDYAKGLEHLSRAVELGERDGRAYGLMGYCYINLESYLAAEQAYRNAILMEPDQRDWKLGLARALLATEHYKDAVALFESLIAETPDDPNLWLLQANALVGLEKPMAAAANLEAVRMMGKAQSSSLVLLGDIYMNEGMAEFARDAYVDVVESDREGTHFSTAFRAADLLVRTRAWDDAAEMLASIDERYASSLAQNDKLKVLTLRAKVARAQGRESEAAKLLASIVESDGTRGDALLELASYHDAEGDREKALLFVERAQNLDGFEYQALLAHAQLRVKAREYRQAVDLLRTAIQINPEPRVERFLARVEASIRR